MRCLRASEDGDQQHNGLQIKLGRGLDDPRPAGDVPDHARVKRPETVKITDLKLSRRLIPRNVAGKAPEVLKDRAAAWRAADYLVISLFPSLLRLETALEGFAPKEHTRGHQQDSLWDPVRRDEAVRLSWFPGRRLGSCPPRPQAQG